MQYGTTVTTARGFDVPVLTEIDLQVWLMAKLALEVRRDGDRTLVALDPQVMVSLPGLSAALQAVAQA
jgi:hypothetical protein